VELAVQTWKKSRMTMPSGFEVAGSASLEAVKQGSLGRREYLSEQRTPPTDW
jgi:hypothetical protein